MQLFVLFLAVGAASAATVQQYETVHKFEREYPLDAFLSKGRQIFSRALGDVLNVFMEEKQKGAFTPKNVARLIKGTSEETARMMPSSNAGIKALAGIGGIAVGLTAMGYGSQSLSRSMADAYQGFDWRSGISAMSRDDFLERTFDWMNVQDVACKRKIVCEIEQYAANKSTLKTFVLRFLSKRHPGLAPYQEAVENGLDRFNCADIYDTCPHSFTDVVGSIPVDRLGVNFEYFNSVPWKLIAEKLQEVKSYL